MLVGYTLVFVSNARTRNRYCCYPVRGERRHVFSAGTHLALDRRFLLLPIVSASQNMYTNVGND